ncbi:hypothetical protein JCM33374_g2416 [Metschnikowia sp. JCM 33374]|nr:hypothetical protein JCM33374_g2416 [Metschnikowia sp. JCM 33374]
MLSRSSHILAQIERTISMLSGAAMLLIVVPLFTIFAFDFVAYISSMAAQTLAQSLNVHMGRFCIPEAEIVPYTSVVFKMNSSGAMREFFSKVSSAKLMPPMMGMWLKITEEEH